MNIYNLVNKDVAPTLDETCFSVQSDTKIHVLDS